MKNIRFVVYLFVTVLLVAPFNPVNAMLSTPDNYLGEEVRERRTLNPQLRLMNLYIKSFKDYTKQVKTYFENLHSTCPKEPEFQGILKALQEKVQTQEGNVKWAKDIQNSIYELNSGEIKSQKLLYEWLGTRLTALNLRRKNNLEYGGDYNTSELDDFLGLADPNCPNSAVSNEFNAEFITKLISKISNDQFELFNHLIASLYTITPQTELGPRVRELISASPGLWPLLQGDSSESLDMDSSIRDSEFYANCIIKNVPKTTQLMNWTRKNAVILVTPQEAGLSDLSLDRPSWLYGEPEPQKSSKDETSKTVIDSKSKKKPARKTKPSQQTPKPQLVVANVNNNNIKQEEPLRENFAESEPASASQLPEPIKVIAVEHEDVLPARGTRLFHFHEPKIISDEQKTRFAGKLNSTHLKVLKTIFDNKLNGQGFCFRELESLWEALNGKGLVAKTGRGGSHRILLWDPGQNEKFVVAGSTFTHGPNHTYTSKTVRYIRDAFTSIGYPWDID